VRIGRYRITVLVCVLVALWATPSHYLAHFHRAVERRSLPPHLLGYEAPDEHSEHAPVERCGLCLQFDRLPAAPAAAGLAGPSLVLVALHGALPEAQRESATLPWQPPSRGPPASTVNA
jgi:hypothetical protein